MTTGRAIKLRVTAAALLVFHATATGAGIVAGGFRCVQGVYQIGDV
jgi:hypothetical protein